MRKKNIFVLMLILVLMVICALPVSAAADAAPGEVTAQSEVMNPGNETGVSSMEDSAADMPVVIEDGSEQDTGEDMAALEAEEPTVTKSNNTPYFIGAGIAVLLFVGVALYCRANGNR